MIFRPILLGCSDKGKGRAAETPATSEGTTAEPEPESTEHPELSPHSDERQVKLDVIRSFVSYPTGEYRRRARARLSLTARPHADVTAEEKEELRNKLEKVIVTTLRRHPSLQYFQGYHDVSWLSLPPTRANRHCYRLSRSFS